MRWTRNIATRERNTFKAWQKNAKERQDLEEPGADWKVILKLILKLVIGKCGLDSSGSR
jgi:hypothetical protein